MWSILVYMQMQGRNRHIFLRFKVIFPHFFPCVKCFSPVENSTNFSQFKKWKAKKKKKKKKKKKNSTYFCNFSSFHFQFSTFSFSIFIFSAQFSLFSFPLFSRYVSRNFPVRSLWGVPLPPTYYTTVYMMKSRRMKYIKITIHYF